MLFIFALLSILTAIGLLVALSIVDLRVRLLPNEMVLGLLSCGVVFHLATSFLYVSAPEAALGAGAGFGSLYLVRLVANALYNDDAMGLGDVKLVGAGGFWIGIDGIFLAIALGALAGVLHGIGHGVWTALRDGKPVQLRGLAIPAGPGFAIGIAAVAAWEIRDFFGFPL